MKTETKRPYLYYNWNQIKTSELLSPDRIAELETLMERSKIDLHFADGAPVNFDRHQAWRYPDGSVGLTLKDTASSREYGERCFLNEALADAEIELLSRHCLDASNRRREAERLAKARREFIETYDKPVWWHDTFYRDIESLYDAIAEAEEIFDGEVIVWGSTSREVIGSLDVSDICGHVIEDQGWEDMGIDDLEGVEEFSQALEKFKKANSGTISYDTDYSVALVVPAEKVRELQAHLHEELNTREGVGDPAKVKGQDDSPAAGSSPAVA